MNYKFNFDKFEKSLQETVELNENERMAHYILETISAYIDCETNFFFNITQEQISIAMEMLYRDDFKSLKSMIMAEGAISLTSNLKSNKKSSKEDLF